MDCLKGTTREMLIRFRITGRTKANSFDRGMRKSNAKALRRLRKNMGR